MRADLGVLCVTEFHSTYLSFPDWFCSYVIFPSGGNYLEDCPHFVPISSLIFTLLIFPLALQCTLVSVPLFHRNHSCQSEMTFMLPKTRNTFCHLSWNLLQGTFSVLSLRSCNNIHFSMCLSPVFVSPCFLCFPIFWNLNIPHRVALTFSPSFLPFFIFSPSFPPPSFLPAFLWRYTLGEVYVCMHAHVNVYMCMYRWTCMCVHGSQSLTLGIFLNYSLPYLSRHDLSMNLVFTHSDSHLASEL